MARTIRTVPYWAKNTGFEKKFERGLVPAPISATIPLEEVWGKNGKRFAKKEISRMRRRGKTPPNFNK
jgi:hypothetical protein